MSHTESVHILKKAQDMYGRGIAAKLIVFITNNSEHPDVRQLSKRQNEKLIKRAHRAMLLKFQASKKWQPVKK
jgi:FAD synthase